jgi:hypothetical protein
LNGEATAESAVGFRRLLHAQPCGRDVRGPISSRAGGYLVSGTTRHPHDAFRGARPGNHLRRHLDRAFVALRRAFEAPALLMSPEHMASGEIPWKNRHRLVAAPALVPDERRSATDTLRVDQRLNSTAPGRPDGRGFASPGPAAGCRGGDRDRCRCRAPALHGPSADRRACRPPTPQACRRNAAVCERDPS